MSSLEEVDFNEGEEDENYNYQKEDYGNSEAKSSSYNHHPSEGKFKRDSSLDVVVRSN